jgi:hypothetical protein
MIEIIKNGTLETGDQLKELMNYYGQVIIPTEDEDLELTHWWAIREDGSEVLYVGTPETFMTYVRERNGGVQ